MRTEKIPVRLLDVLAEDGIEGQAPIDAQCELLSDEERDSGIVISVDGECRIVVENYQGKLVCHVWGTPESIGNDPTDSLLVEQRKE